MGKTCYHDDWQLETGAYLVVFESLLFRFPHAQKIRCSLEILGQIVVSKTGNRGLNLAALHIAAHMQLEHPFYFKLSDGDKDTFRYGFWALGAYTGADSAMIAAVADEHSRDDEAPMMYSTAPWWLSTLGFHDDWEQGRFCGIAMVQVSVMFLRMCAVCALPWSFCS